MKEFHKHGYEKIFIILMISQFITSSCSRKTATAYSAPESKVQRGNTQARIPQSNHKLRPEIQKDNHDIINLSEKIRSGECINTGVEKYLKAERIKAEDILETARGYFGVPHCMGGLTKKCIDCSGLLVKVFAAYGINLPHSAQEQSRYGETITSKNDLVKGDLVFFTRSYKTKNYITHTGIYAGENKFIHASSHKGVSITSLDDPYWKPKFAFGKRILE